LRAGGQIGLFRDGRIAPQYTLFRRRALGLLALRARHDYFIIAPGRRAAVVFARLYRVLRRLQSHKTYRPVSLSDNLVNFRILDRAWNSRHETAEYFFPRCNRHCFTVKAFANFLFLKILYIHAYNIHNTDPGRIEQLFLTRYTTIFFFVNSENKKSPSQNVNISYLEIKTRYRRKLETCS